MRIVLQQVPIEAAGFAPLIALSEFLAHEEKFLARVSALIRQEQTEICELLPQIAGHFVEQRVFSVNDFVVGKGQHEILGEGIEHRERHLVVLVFAVNRVLREIAERIVHPAHVPFQAEAESAEIGGPGDTGPGRGLFGDGENAREAAMRDFIHALDESDRM